MRSADNDAGKIFVAGLLLTGYGIHRLHPRGITGAVSDWLEGQRRANMQREQVEKAAPTLTMKRCALCNKEYLFTPACPRCFPMFNESGRSELAEATPRALLTSGSTDASAHSQEIGKRRPARGRKGTGGGRSGRRHAASRAASPAKVETPNARKKKAARFGAKGKRTKLRLGLYVGFRAQGKDDDLARILTLQARHPATPRATKSEKIAIDRAIRKWLNNGEGDAWKRYLAGEK